MTDEFDLIIVVKSGILGWQARQSFREFMHNETARNPNFRVGYVFSVGQPRETGGRIFNRDGQEFSLNESLGDLLEKYDGVSDELRKNITAEADKYGDILLGDYADTYFNLTWKTVTNLRWLSTFCDTTRHDTFMLLDDDHRVNLSMVQRFLMNTPKSIKRQSIFGFVLAEDKPDRSRFRKCFLSNKEFPMNKFPPYPLGSSQFIGADVIDDMAIASAYTRYNYFPEDVFLGVIGFKLGIPMRNETTMHSHDRYEINNKDKKPAMVALNVYFQKDSRA